MSQENVDVFRRAVEAINRGDVQPMLDAMDPEVEWYPVIPLAFGGEAAVLRGREAIRSFNREETESGAVIDFQYTFTEIRDLGDRLVAIGIFHTRGRHSKLDSESPIAYVVDFKDGNIISARGYFDPAAALDAAGLRE